MKIRYFAWVREKVGVDKETLDLPGSVTSVTHLIEFLKARDERYATAFEEQDAIRVALDQMHVEHDEPLGNVQEVAFFPPMTGG
ncbi:molybdopterin converting factor subunit 1 [Roseibium sp.]|uniref:molybdopterin converting factor subunit 1 n=1 Tax=Roseibium sp. TaxID=1936156 RepID=UPI003265694C